MMACVLFMLSIIYGVLFLTSSAAITRRPSLPRTSYTYYIDSGLPSTWYNNNSEVIHGHKLRVILSIRDYYCGFHCSGDCSFYSFSVAWFGEGSYEEVWSANTDHPLRENASVQLTRGQGLVLRDSDGITVWSAPSTSHKSVVGLNLTEGGKLVLFDNQSAVVWQSFDDSMSSSSEDMPKFAVWSIIVSLTGYGFLVLVILVVFLKRRSEKNRKDNIKQVLGIPLRFSFEELEIATENFKRTLGSGGFGSVFKGILKDGTRIAVKRLDKMSQDMREFLAEVETMGGLHHFNLVRLVGFCVENSSRFLVYEYMSNGSLDNWIFNRDQAHHLDWKTKMKIILDIAKGLAYLHEDCRRKIIHLDIKPHNILLDENFNAKVSDFGLSKLIDRDESQVLIPMRGTPGYLAPELQQSIVTVKADVYSFGIVILEILSKRRNVDRLLLESSFHLLEILQKKDKQDRLIEIVEDLDEDMQNNSEEIVKMIRIGAWCLQNDHTRRPLMSTVVKVLEGVTEVEPNISYKFAHEMPSFSVKNDHITMEPQASILSAPR